MDITANGGVVNAGNIVGFTAVAVAGCILSFGLGFLLRPSIDDLKDHPAGSAVKCIAKGSVCVGMDAAALRAMGEEVGGVIDVSCGFGEPGAGAGRSLSVVELVHRGCDNARYVVSYSNSQRLTNVWVNGDKIVRLDDYPRHVIDL